MPAGPGPDGVIDRVGELVNRLAVRIEGGLAVEHPVALLVHPELDAERLERVVVGRVGREPAGEARGRDQGPAHRVLGEGAGDVRVAPGAPGVADVPDVRADVVERALVREPGVGRERGVGRGGGRVGRLRAEIEPVGGAGQGEGCRQAERDRDGPPGPVGRRPGTRGGVGAVWCHVSSVRGAGGTRSDGRSLPDRGTGGHRAGGKSAAGRGRPLSGGYAPRRATPRPSPVLLTPGPRAAP